MLSAAADNTLKSKSAQFFISYKRQKSGQIDLLSIQNIPSLKPVEPNLCKVPVCTILPSLLQFPDERIFSLLDHPSSGSFANVFGQHFGYFFFA